MSTAANEYMQTYTSYSGVDIVGSFNGKVFAELQGITYSISREKAAVYTMGSAEPRSFSRGKRGIAGTLVFTVFDRDALLDEFGKVMQNNEELKIQKYQMNDPNNVNEKAHVSTGFTSIEKWVTKLLQ